jgi:hypothetical protein
MNRSSTSSVWSVRFAIAVARSLLALAFLALIGAWIAQLTGGTFIGLSQQHLFNDTFALGMLSIGVFLDALWHSRGM